MAAESERHLVAPGAQGNFATTHWSLVRAARDGSSAQARQALATLCESYWYPLYAFVRRQGYQPADAQDLTQGFFARLIEKQDLGAVDQTKGRFRAFLLASLKHFLMNEWDKARAQKRGGGHTCLTLDFDVAETKYRREPYHGETAEAIFDREWALTLLDQARSQLAAEHRTERQRQQFELLQLFLSGEPRALSYAEAGERIGMTEGAVKVAVHRLRGRFRDLLRAHIRQTVDQDHDIDDEIRDLFEVLRGTSNNGLPKSV